MTDQFTAQPQSINLTTILATAGVCALLFLAMLWGFALGNQQSPTVAGPITSFYLEGGLELVACTYINEQPAQGEETCNGETRVIADERGFYQLPLAYGSYMVRPKTNRWPIIYPGRELGEDSVPNSSAAVVHLDVGLGYCAGQDAVQIWHNSTDGSEEVAQQAAGYVLAAGGDYTLTINGFNGCVPEATTVVDRPVEQLHPSIKGQLPSSLPNAGHGPLR
jgi:hypothetical protein